MQTSSFFTHLECSVPCGAGWFDPSERHHLCTCGMPLLARYDLEAARRGWARDSLAGREPSMWRYREVMPLRAAAAGLEAPVSLGEGWTPLLHARRLGATRAEVVDYRHSGWVTEDDRRVVGYAGVLTD